jgi:hypothetical protein
LPVVKIHLFRIFQEDTTTKTTSTTTIKPGQDFECNFEHDSCGWTAAGNIEDYNWVRTTSKQCNEGDNCACPPNDLSHTEEGKDGNILF